MAFETGNFEPRQLDLEEYIINLLRKEKKDSAREDKKPETDWYI